MRVGTGFVVIKADRKGLEAGLKKAQIQVSNSLDKMDKKIRSLTFTSLKLGAAAASAAIVYNLKKSVDAASDLEETVNKFGVVFGEQTDIANAWAENLRKNYAMSEREAKAYLAAMQDLLVPMGMNADAAGKMSNEVVKLAADLGSFNNLPTAQVMGDIQSALVGNYETMKKYGVVLTATTVQQRAMAMGLAESKEALTAGHKAHAAYTMIVEGSKFAVGDMIRTTSSYANQMKQLGANLEDTRAIIGKELMPIVADYVKQLNNWMRTNETLIRQKVPEYAEKISKALWDIWDIISYDPAIMEWGLIGLALGGTKWGIITGGIAHLKKVVEYQARALALVQTGALSLQDLVFSNYEELKKLVDDVDARLSGVRHKISEAEGYADYLAQHRAIGGGAETTGGGADSGLTPAEWAEQQKLERGMLEWRIENAQAYDDAIIEGHEAMLEMERERYEEMKVLDSDFWQFKLANAQAYDEAILAANEGSLQYERHITKEKDKLAKQAAKNAIDSGLYALSVLGKENKAAFEIFKFAESAKTMVLAIESAQGIYAALSPYGPFVAAAGAALALAEGMARVHQIQSMSYEGGGAAATAPTGVYAASPTTGLPETTTGTERTGPTINVYIENHIDTEENNRNIIEMLNDFVENRGGYLRSSHAIIAERVS